MDFFAHQEVADRQTRRLVILFGVAVLAIIGAVYSIVYVLFYEPWALSSGDGARSFWDPGLLALAAAGVLAVIGAGSLYKTIVLRSGGRAVAQTLGGREIDTNTTDPDERRLLNVVEEMALASGVPVPTVYLLERETGINAFAAGHTFSDAVIAVSQGGLRLLSRDELQGVIGHEFSHILRGDMRLNLRLMGLLHGILLISLLGYGILRSLRFASAGAGRRSIGAGIAFAGLFGLLLMIVGWIGVFFGRLIKSAISRQREFLADAAAVQFTRNPDGITGALTKIGGLGAGSTIRSARAEEASHLFFGDFRLRPGSSLLSTHPPLADRIGRLDPGFDGVFPPVEALPVPAISGIKPLSDRPGPAPTPPTPPPKPTPILDQIGNIDQAHLAYAAALLAEMPPALRTGARQPADAQAIVYALLLDPDPVARRQQTALLDELETEAIHATTVSLQPLVDSLPRHARIPLLDLLRPALSRLGYARYQRFRRTLQALIEADRQISLFEYTVLRHVMRHLGTAFGDETAPRAQYYSLGRLGDDTSILLSALAHTGSQEVATAETAFGWGRQQLDGPSEEFSFRSREECSLGAVDEALDRLILLSPRLKRSLLQAAAETVAFDRTVTLAEAELMRAVADALDCPVPPLLPGQSLKLN